MKSSSILMLFGLALVSFCSYVMYTPVPDDMSEPWKYRLVIAEREVIKLIACMQSFLFSTDYTSNVRMLRHQSYSMFSVFNRGVKHTTNSTYTTFDGVPVLFYTPMSKKEGLQAAFIYIHGGGRAFGSTVLYEGLTRQFAERLQIPIVSIEYRLAPENPRLSDYEDCLKASIWFLNHADQFSVDKHRVAIGGDSAGGSLSAALAQYVHDKEDLEDFALQVLIYPSTQILDMNLPSHQMYRHNFGEGGFLSVKAIGIFASLYFLQEFNVDFINTVTFSNYTAPALKRHPEWQEFVDHNLVPIELRDPTYYSAWPIDSVGDEAFWETHGEQIIDVRLNPGLRHELSGLPPAFIATCDLDSIRDDGIIYAKRLEKAGVQAKLVNYKGAFHAIAWLGGGLPHVIEFKVGKQMIDDIIEHTTRVLKL